MNTRERERMYNIRTGYLAILAVAIIGFAIWVRGKPMPDNIVAGRYWYFSVPDGWAIEESGTDTKVLRGPAESGLAANFAVTNEAFRGSIREYAVELQPRLAAVGELYSLVTPFGKGVKATVRVPGVQVTDEPVMRAVYAFKTGLRQVTVVTASSPIESWARNEELFDRTMRGFEVEL